MLLFQSVNLSRKLYYVLIDAFLIRKLDTETSITHDSDDDLYMSDSELQPIHLQVNDNAMDVDVSSLMTY